MSQKKVAKKNFEGDDGKLDFRTPLGHPDYLGPFGPFWVILYSFGLLRPEIWSPNAALNFFCDTLYANVDKPILEVEPGWNVI